MRAWGHRFIYDEPTLRRALETAGFTNVTRREMNEGGDAALRNLDNAKRIPDGFLRPASLILEGSKARDAERNGAPQGARRRNRAAPP